MDPLEAIIRQAYADGLAGVTPPRAVWTGSDDFSRVYCEAWMAGALDATAPDTTATLAVSSVTARA